MPSCIVLSCKRVSKKDEDVSGENPSFFKLPVVKGCGEQNMKLAKARRDAWLNQINRPDLKPESIRHQWICSRHFMSGKPADLNDMLDPDWLPTLNLSESQEKVKDGACELPGIKVESDEISTEDNEEVVAISAEDYEKNVCRFCLSINTNGQFPHALFTEDNEPTLLLNMVKSFNIEISLDTTHLPRNICDDCHKIIEDFSKLQEKIVENEKLFEKVCETFKLKNKDETPDASKKLMAKMLSKIMQNKKDGKELDEAIYEENTENVENSQSSERRERSERRAFRKPASTANDSGNKEDKDEEDTIKAENYSDEDDDADASSYLLPEIEYDSDSEFVSPQKGAKRAKEPRKRGRKKIKREDSPTPLDLEDDQFSDNCILCGKNFQRKIELILHFLQHTVAYSTNDYEKRTFCKMCGIVYVQKEELTQHCTQAHSESIISSYLCEFCGSKFETEVDQMEHELAAQHYPFAENQSVDCPLCSETYNGFEELFKHSAKHLLKTYSCTICKTSFVAEVPYYFHLKSQHDRNVFLCNVCHKPLSSKGALSTHLKEIHSPRRLVCDVCGKTCASEASLRRHLPTHDLKNIKICSTCGYQTYQNGDLKKHLLIHTNEKPYKCSFSNCGKAFRTQSALSEHNRSHLGIGLICSVCNASLASHYSLKQHMRIHSGERPYNCLICNRDFARRKYLVNHLRSVHRITDVTNDMVKFNARKQKDEKEGEEERGDA